ncbi:Flavin-dependent monooxygenase, oxygenase subunit HsaA [BD1-7 clade bacterium]|uniref:Flavin-dependent monooxygenase, oxygenase subunit HsaA n=1 Tax=BD1-7 clade bacterium TaxID=2029982 RepID=A0A5S9PN85_9GAMM|nr:Flavin-dependent monooxygenase, oxygenase subunit HsaA [BD1-7 clade bacterium]CAA0105637.1 Flavin-dependent monooxygenase, oxygenase subunit HsaA [BD1-7 clade bacterium]
MTDQASQQAIESRRIADEIYGKIVELQPKMRERAQQTKRDRKVPDATINELKDTGFFLALQPKVYGGYEMLPQDFFRLHLAISEACMSTAWASGIIAVHAFQIALMAKKAQEDVWSTDIHTRVSSSYAPVGKVEIVDGGFKLSGRWGWSSGCQHCTWALLGAIVPGEGYRTFLVPIEDYEIIDTWKSMGLEGTGSNDIVVENAFVPDHRTHKQLDGFNLTNPGTAVNTSSLYQIPWAQVFVRVVCTPAIGACKDALRLYTETAQKKASMDPSKHASDPSTLERISTAENTIDEMECIMMRNFDSMMHAINNGKDIGIQNRAKYRYQASLVIDKSMEVIDSLFSMAGGSSVFLGADIQQRFLDIHTARAHVANNPTNFARNLGSLHLGLENQDFFI